MSKPNKNRERREMVEKMRKEAKAAERRRTLTVVAACVVVAAVILGLAGWKLYRDNQKNSELADTRLADIGVAAKSAGCLPIEEQPATGSGEHVTGSVDYDVNPPSFGAHNPVPADRGIHFYTAADRPEVERLVHNEEHGWTIVWYDETVADNQKQLDQLKATGDKFDLHGTDPRYNLIIAPWTEADGDPIPEGKHVAFTHWTVHQPTYDPSFYQQKTIESFGASEYCDTFSGDALDTFMQKYPYDDAPEGYLWHQSG